MIEVIKSSRIIEQGGRRFVEGERVDIPKHRIVNALGVELDETCPSRKGVVSFNGGVAYYIVEAKCERNYDPKNPCFFSIELS